MAPSVAESQDHVPVQLTAHAAPMLWLGTEQSLITVLLENRLTKENSLN